MAVSPTHTGWRRKLDGNLELYVQGTLVGTFTTTGVTWATGYGITTTGVLTGNSLVVVTGDVNIDEIAYTFPTDNGDAGEQLQTNGSGVLTWEASGV